MSASERLKREHNEAMHDPANNGSQSDCPYCSGADDEGNTWGADDDKHNNGTEVAQ